MVTKNVSLVERTTKKLMIMSSSMIPHPFCAARFYYLYISKRPLTITMPMALGIVVHEMIHRFHTVNFSDPQKFLALFAAEWAKAQSSGKVGNRLVESSDEKKWKKSYFDGKQALAGIVEHYSNVQPSPVFTEQKVHVHTNQGRKIVAIMDAIGPKLLVSDYKTSFASSDFWVLDQDQQPTLYLGGVLHLVTDNDEVAEKLGLDKKFQQLVRDDPEAAIDQATFRYYFLKEKGFHLTEVKRSYRQFKGALIRMDMHAEQLIACAHRGFFPPEAGPHCDRCLARLRCYAEHGRKSRLAVGLQDSMFPREFKEGSNVEVTKASTYLPKRKAREKKPPQSRLFRGIEATKAATGEKTRTLRNKADP